MTTFSFDCSQFIVVPGLLTESLISAHCELFRSLPCKLRFGQELDQRKLDYLTNVFGRNITDSVLEIVDDEFQGVFEDWKDPQFLPAELEAVYKILSALLIAYPSVSLVFIGVSTMNPNRIFNASFAFSDFNEAVFTRSLFSASNAPSAEAWIFNFTHSPNSSAPTK
jgi:hypothetical protein